MEKRLREKTAESNQVWKEKENFSPPLPLSHLLPQPPDARVVHLPGVFRCHVVHHRVDLPLQGAHDRQSGHVQGDPGPRCEALAASLGQEARAAADDVAGTRGGLDDDCFVVGGG
jgi:hypothetical protein